MRFEDFIQKGQVRKGSPDVQLSKSLIKQSEKDLRYLQTQVITDDSARKIMISYYDTLRSILEAVATKEGYKVYSHEAFSCYLELKNEPSLAVKFDRFRKIRNGLNYYGNEISPPEVEEHILEIKKMIALILSRYLP